ncbi:hypothetical protein ECANGB1_1613 [Enterospora canceri]|uniref:Uncharacterized protein n=1 Tax=Enterospora canceri TaxID=1081671 RepID=A0A1Y1S5S1_9MICR|nr:hypothetical protein ECANGB1_1613 [Enterospora canceri]
MFAAPAESPIEVEVNPRLNTETYDILVQMKQDLDEQITHLTTKIAISKKVIKKCNSEINKAKRIINKDKTPDDVTAAKRLKQNKERDKRKENRTLLQNQKDLTEVEANWLEQLIL